MPVLDADPLNTDPQGMEFLRDVLGTRAEAEAPGRRFPVEAWTAKTSAASSQAAALSAPAPDQVAPRFADALA